MAREASSKVTLTHEVVERVTGIGVGERAVALPHRIQHTSEASNGTGTGQVDRVWSDSGSVTSGTPVAIDVLGDLDSVLTGDSVDFVRLTGITVIHRGGAGDLRIGGAAANGLAGWISDAGEYVAIGAGGKFHVSSPGAGWTPVAGTGDLLQLAASAGTVQYDIILEGRSAAPS